MHRVGPEGPDVAGGAGLLADPAEPVDKCRPVGVVREELPALNPPHDDMLESARRVNASLARHGARLAQAEAERDLYFFEKRADPASHRNALLMVLAGALYPAYFDRQGIGERNGRMDKKHSGRIPVLELRGYLRRLGEILGHGMKLPPLGPVNLSSSPGPGHPLCPFCDLWRSLCPLAGYSRSTDPSAGGGLPRPAG